MPTWQAPQDFAMLAWLECESLSMLRLMSWTPWQSLHEGATMSPILTSALPWMLSR
ncbi:hypothetical protein D3C84_1250970 [compost metagenome]